MDPCGPIRQPRDEADDMLRSTADCLEAVAQYSNLSARRQLILAQEKVRILHDEWYLRGYPTLLLLRICDLMRGIHAMRDGRGATQGTERQAIDNVLASIGARLPSSKGEEVAGAQIAPILSLEEGMYHEAQVLRIYRAVAVILCKAHFIQTD